MRTQLSGNLEQANYWTNFMDDIELIKQKINIVDLISEYLPLKKAGINYKTNCPFHQERTPSFMVSLERGIFHCFGCGVGGDIFKFLMEKEGIEFKDALEQLAQKAGVVLKRTPQKKDSKDRLFELNLKAKQFFHYILTEHKLGKKALEYLKERGLTQDTIKQFELGYAFNNWESLTEFLKKRGFSTNEIIASGMGVASRRGCYDRFRGRIMFPLLDIRGRVLGFSGRILGIGDPKYINSPQTDIFDKGKFLFGLNLSKGDIKQKDEAIMVEGEMDMILSFQSQVKNIIASKGTALTQDQIDSLKKYTNNIVLGFDTDLAGDAASRRGIELLDQTGFNIKVVSLQGAKDPAEICLADPKKWMKIVEDAQPIYDYYLHSIGKRYDLKKASSKKAIFEELLPIWRKISDEVVKEHYIQKLAAYLQIKDDLIRKSLNKPQTPINMPPITLSKRDDSEVKDRHKLLEKYLVALLLHFPSDHTYIPNFPETIFTQEELKQVYVLFVLFLDGISFKGQSFKISEFIKTLPEILIPLADRLFLMQIDDKLIDPKAWQKEVETVVSELKKILIKSSLEKLSLQIKHAQEFEKIESLEILNKKFRDLSVKLKNL